MAKRFIDSEIWDKVKFNEANTKIKLLTLFITCKCDCVGILKMAPMLINAYLGQKITEQDILSIPCDIVKISENTYFLTKFCNFQYGELNPKSPPHRKYIALLKENNLYDTLNNTLSLPFQYPIEGVEEEEKEEEEEEEKEKEKEKEEERQVLDYLNFKTGKRFKSSHGLPTRLKEGYTINDAKKVIDIKYNQWSHDEKMRKFLRPETLFSQKFDSYLNELTENDTKEEWL